MRKLFDFLLVVIICLLATFAGKAFAAPGGFTPVIYYSDGAKILKGKLYLSDGKLAMALGTTASGGNVAFGGESAASASTQYPVLIERTLSNAVHLQISNPSSNAAASAKIQLSTDAGDKLGELGIFPNEATTAAYTSAMTVRPNGNATRLSLIGGDLATGHVTFYVAGDYTSAGEALRVNADKSIQFMQQISTPATPASGSAKVYVKSDDLLYYLADGGTEQQVITSSAAPWFIKASLAGANIDLGVTSQASYIEAANSGLTLTPVSGSAAVGTVCNGTNAATAPSTSPTTCAAGNEGMGISFTPPGTGWYEVCVAFADRIILDEGEHLSATFQLVETATNAQTILQEGGERAKGGSVAGAAAGADQSLYFPRRVCGFFNLTGGAARNIRLMYEQSVTGAAPDIHIIEADANADNGQPDMMFTVKRIH